MPVVMAKKKMDAKAPKMPMKEVGGKMKGKAKGKAKKVLKIKEAFSGNL